MPRLSEDESYRDFYAALLRAVAVDMPDLMKQSPVCVQLGLFIEGSGIRRHKDVAGSANEGTTGTVTSAAMFTSVKLPSLVSLRGLGIKSSHLLLLTFNIICK